MSELRGQECQRLRKLHDELLTLPLKDLYTALRLLKENPDNRGRLHGERSGEAQHGEQSEMERIIAAKERQAELGGRRITPAGHGSDTADSLGGSPSVLGSAIDHQHEEKAQVISELIAKHHVNSMCTLCGAFIPDHDAAEKHFWSEYKKGLRQYNHYETLSDPKLSIPIPATMLEEARLLYLQCKHFQAVLEGLQKKHQRKRKRGGNIVTKDHFTDS